MPSGGLPTATSVPNTTRTQRARRARRGPRWCPPRTPSARGSAAAPARSASQRVPPGACRAGSAGRAPACLRSRRAASRTHRLACAPGRAPSRPPSDCRRRRAHSNPPASPRATSTVKTSSSPASPYVSSSRAWPVWRPGRDARRDVRVGSPRSCCAFDASTNPANVAPSAEKDDDRRFWLTPAEMLAHGARRPARVEAVDSRAPWTSTSTRGRSSSAATGSPCPRGGSRRPGRGACGRGGARGPGRRQGAGAHRRTREGGRDQAREHRRRGRGAREGDPRHGHPRSRRDEGLDRARVGHRARVLPLTHVRPEREEAALHVHDAGRDGHRGGRRDEPGRARATPRRPARGLSPLACAQARLRRRRRGSGRAEADRGDRVEALRGLRRQRRRCSARSTR